MGRYSWRSRGITVYQMMMPLLAAVCLFFLAGVADRPRFGDLRNSMWECGWHSGGI